MQSLDPLLAAPVLAPWGVRGLQVFMQIYARRGVICGPATCPHATTPRDVHQSSHMATATRSERGRGQEKGNLGNLA